MAKKKVNWEDLFNDSTAPSWAVQERQNFLNDDKKYNAIIDAYANDMGVEFDAATRREMLRDLHAGKTLTFGMAPEEVAPSAPTSSPAPEIPSKAKPGLFENTVTSMMPTEGLRQAIASLFSRQQETAASNDAGIARFDELVGSNPDIIRKNILAEMEAVQNGERTMQDVAVPGDIPSERPMTSAEKERELTMLRRSLAEVDQKEKAGFYSKRQNEAAAKKTEAQGIAQAYKQRADQAEAQLTPGSARVSRNVGQALQTEQFLPQAAGIIGALRGPAAATAAASIASVPQAELMYKLSYVDAVDNFGATPEEAAGYAGALTAIEFGSEALGGATSGALTIGKSFLNKMGGKATKELAKQTLEKTIKGRLTRVAQGYGAELASEELSNVGQHYVDTVLEGTGFGSAAGQEELAKRNEAYDFFDELKNTAIQVAAISGPVSPVAAHAGYKADIKEQQSRRLNDILTGEATVGDAALAQRRSEEAAVKAAEEARTRTPEQTSLFDTPQPTQTFEEQDAARRKQIEEDAAWSIREQQRAQEQQDQTRPARVEELRDSIVRRVDTATDKVEQLRALVEDGDTSSATLSSLAAAQREETVAKRTLSDFDTNFAQQQEQTQAAQPKPAKEPTQQELPLPENPQIVEANALLEEAKKRQAKTENNKKTAEKGQETIRRNKLAAQVLTEHGDKTPQEQAQILSDMLADKTVQPKSAVKEQTPEEKVQGVINQVEGLRKSKATARVNNRIRSLYRQDPTRSAKDIADILAREEGTATQEENAPTEEEIAKKVADLNKSSGVLNMDNAADVVETREQEAVSKSENGPAPRRTAEQQKTFVKKVQALVGALGNTQQNVDIHNLIRQGKMIVTDRPESVGRKSSDAPAAFVPAEGKMYVYLDNFDPKQGKEVMLQAAAQHEAGHAGQFNQRDGRNNLFKNLLGDKGNAAANQLIRNAAKSGNKLAQEAVKKATAAAKTNNAFTNVEDLELVPYLFSEAKMGKHAPGTVGKVIRDVKNAARAVTRATLNKELEYSVDELAAAGERVGGEIVKTNLEPKYQTGKGKLDMIYAEGATGFNSPENVERSYTSADGKRKYVLSDKDSKLRPGAEFSLLSSMQDGTTFTLDDIYQHDILYKELPAAKDIKVQVLPDSAAGGYAYYDPETKNIVLTRSLVEGRRPTELREGLLHEVQHWVQDHTGRGGEFYDSRENTLTPELQKLVDNYKTASKARAKAARNVLDNLVDVTREAPLPIKNRIREKILGNINMTDVEKVNAISSMLSENDVAIRPEGQKLLSKLSEANRAYGKEMAAFNSAENDFTENNLAHYYANINEAEGHRTQYDRNLSQEELDRRGNPEEAMRRQHGNRTGGRLDVPTPNGRQRTVKALGQEEQSLSMEAPSEETKAANPKNSIKERINRILSHGRQDRLDTVKIAEDLHTQLVDAVHQDSGGRVLLGFNIGDTKLSSQMNKDFMEFLSNPAHTTPEGRERLISEMKDKYPATTKVLLEARDRISDMTMDVINDMLSTGRPLSVTQRKQIGTMLANKDTYLSRAYAAFQADKGRKWAQTRWKNFAKNIGVDVESITNPKVKADVKAVRDAITVITKGLTIPDETALQDMTMDQLLSLADRHGIKESQLQFDREDPDAQWLKRDELVSELLKVKDSYPEGKLEEIAMMDAKDLLGLGDRESLFAKQMSALARNPGTLKEKQRVPLEIRRLLGEIELAPGVFMATMANQAALRARAKVVSELVNDPQGDIALSRDKWLNLPEKERNKYKEVRSEEWGALNGMYLRDYAYNRMEEVTGLMYSWRDAVKRMSHDVSPLTGKLIKGATGTLGALNRWNKLATVVYNPWSWMGNFGGSFLNMVGAGNYSPTAMKEGMGTAREYVGGTFKTTTTPRLSKVIKYMNLEAADIAELQKVLGNTLEKYFDNPTNMQDAVAKLDKHGHSLAGRLHKSVIAGYAIADNWSKISNFYHRYGVLKNMYDAADISKTEDQILQEAGDDTSYTNISPERVHSVIRTAESAGLTQYGPYFAEVLRTRVTNVLLAHKDFKRANQLKADGHSKAANIMYTTAASRLAGQLIVNAALPAVGAFKLASRLAAIGVPTALAYSLANSMSALGGDDEDSSKKRRMLSEANRVQDMMLVGKNADGYPIYLPFSQKLDPNGPFTDIVRVFAYSEDGEDLYKNLLNYGVENLLIFPQIIKDGAASVTKDNFPESDIGRLLPRLKQEVSETFGANNSDRILNVLDNLVPGVFRAYKTQNTTDGVVTDPSTKQALELANLAGIRFETLDPRRTLKGYADVSNDTKAKNNGVLNRELLNVPTPNKKTVMDATEKFFREELARQKEDYKNVQSLRAWKFDDEQIAELLKQGGYPKKAIPDMVEGNAVVALKLKSLLQYAESSGSYQDSREYAKRQEKVVALVQLIQQMEPELNEMGIAVDASEMPKGWNE